MSPNELTSKLYNGISDENEPRVYEHWHASSIAQCPKAHYLERKGQPHIAVATGAKQLRWRVGHLIEQEIRPQLNKLFPNLKSNVRLDSKTWDLTGEYDNFDPDSGYLIEIKSVGPRAIRYRKNGEDRYHLRSDGPYPGHEWQQHAYVLLLQEAGVEVKGITYLYITLEGLLVPYMTGVRHDILETVKARLKLLNEAWRLQNAPQCVCNESNPLWGSVLQFCPYRSENNCCEEKK